MKLPTFIFWGQSNMGGVASLSLVDGADYQRWTGRPKNLSTLPVDMSVPGIYYLTPRMPYGSTTTYTGISFPNPGEVQVTPSPGWGVDVHVDKWIWFKADANGAQLRRINANTADTLTIGVALSGTPTGNVRMELYNDSGTVSTWNSTTLTMVTLTDIAVGDSAAADRWLVVMTGAGVGNVARIVSKTGTTLVLDRPVTASGGVGVRILSGGGAVESLADYTASNVAFRELRFYYDVAPSYSTGFDYPNHQSLVATTPLGHASTRFGPDLEACWQLQHAFDSDVFVLKMGIGSAYMSKFLGTLNHPAFSWYRPDQHNDFHPASTDRLTGAATFDLFDVLMETMLEAARAWVQANRSGDTIDIQGIFSMEGESDASDAGRYQLAGMNMRLIRDTMRARIHERGLSTIAAEKIPFVIGLVRETSNVWPYASPVNQAFRQLADDDMYTGVVSTNEVGVLGFDTAHYSDAGQVVFGGLLFQKWMEIRNRESSATTQESRRLTLEELRNRVLRRYEGSDVGNDVTASLANMFINDAIREIMNTLGDNAWFARRIESVTGPFGVPFELPGIVKRVLRIESAECPGQQLAWKSLGYSGNGKLKILIQSAAALPYEVHHIIQQEELVKDGDRSVIPQDYTELIVVLACKRLAESFGNSEVAQYYMAETERLFSWLRRDAQRYERQRKPSLSIWGQPDDFRPVPFRT